MQLAASRAHANPAPAITIKPIQIDFIPSPEARLLAAIAMPVGMITNSQVNASLVPNSVSGRIGRVDAKSDGCLRSSRLKRVATIHKATLQMPSKLSRLIPHAVFLPALVIGALNHHMKWE